MAKFIEHLENYSNLKHKYLKKGKVPLVLAIDDAVKMGLKPEAIEKYKEAGMLKGDLEMTYEGAKRIYEKVVDSVRELPDGEKHEENLKHFDPQTDHDLIAIYLMAILPNAEKNFGNVENLYKVILNVGASEKKGYALPEKEKRIIENKGISSSLESAISLIPTSKFNESDEKARRLRLLLRKKAEREIFPLFKEDVEKAFAYINGKIEGTDNSNLKTVYTDLKDLYNEYHTLEVPNVNREFIDPQTGQKDVLPSIHQKVALYQIVQNKRFGVFDGCGTGKTAIASLAKGLIERQLNSEGKKFRRTVVIGPNNSKKAWKKGLCGNEDERYFTEKQNAFVINGEKKDEDFLKKLESAEWIVANFEQLISDVNGITLAQHIANLGVDYVIIDEGHNIKGKKNVTSAGRPTLSAASRYLANSAEYLTILTGSPIPDTMEDFAVLYHLIHPDKCPSPDDFKKQYKNNPRILYTLFHERTVRRTSEDINNNLDWEEKELLVDLTPNQKTLYDHIVQFRPSNWLIQARKALLDPRLCDPEVIERAGLEGKLNERDSAKYNALIDDLIEGPLKTGEHFVIFSSMFRDGVTNTQNTPLKNKYEKANKKSQYKKLNLEKTLENILSEEIFKRTGKKVSIGIIDGTIPVVEDREKIIDEIGTKLNGVICTTDTGGESLDFTKASYAFFLDDDYTPKTVEQAIARVLRKGQKNKVKIRYLRGKDTLDEDLRDYVEKKRLIQRIAIDGCPLTPAEQDILNDVSGKGFAELIKRGLGGISIDVLSAQIEDPEDFLMRKRVSGGKKKGGMRDFEYTTTAAQEVMKLIGKNPVGCWQDPEFAELYMAALQNLAVPVIHRAKIMNLLNKAKKGEIQWPEKVLSDGSGPSLLYNAFQSLEPIIKSQKFLLPHVTDRDISQIMLDKGENPSQFLGCMTGKESPFDNEEFDMVDNESITLLQNPEDVKKTLLESHRILVPDGILEIVTKNWKFSDGFYEGMEKLGYKILTQKDEGFVVSTNMRNRLKKEHGEHYADAYASKLSNTFVIMAQKVNEPKEVDTKNFWFDRIISKEQPIKMKEEPVIIAEGELFRKSNRRRGPKRQKSSVERQALPGEIKGLSEGELKRTKIKDK